MDGASRSVWAGASSSDIVAIGNRLLRERHASRLTQGETSLDAAMRAPSTTAPDVVVLSFVDEDKKVKEVADPKKDLWISSVDGYVKLIVSCDSIP